MLIYSSMLFNFIRKWGNIVLNYPNLQICMAPTLSMTAQFLRPKKTVMCCKETKSRAKFKTTQPAEPRSAVEYFKQTYGCVP